MDCSATTRPNTILLLYTALKLACYTYNLNVFLFFSMENISRTTTPRRLNRGDAQFVCVETTRPRELRAITRFMTIPAVGICPYYKTPREHLYTLHSTRL